MKQAFIYAITNALTLMMYVGSTASTGHRLPVHTSLLSTGKHHCPYLQNAWRKYGPDVFEFKVLLVVDEANRYEFEQRVINAYAGRLYNGTMSVVPQMNTDIWRDGQKKCSLCGEFKDYPSEYWKRAGACKICARERHKKYSRASYERNLERSREIGRIAARKYREDNPKKAREVMQKYDHSQKRRDWRKQWRAKNHDRLIARRRELRAIRAREAA